MSARCRRRRPGRALGATLGTAALLAAAPASAADQDSYGSLTASGGLEVTWSGDAARGCAAAGLCGYNGSAQLSAEGGKGDYYFVIDGNRLLGESSGISLSSDPVVRVTRTEGGVEKGTCSDRVDSPGLSLFTLKAKRGRARLKVQSDDMSSARCAGPSPLYRALDRLPAHDVSLKQVSKGNTTIDFSGSAPFSVGRFSGTVSSTLKFHLGKAHHPPPPSGRRVARRQAKRRPLIRVVNFRAKYRITSYAGKLSASFGGLTGPPCAQLDFCGVSGQAQWETRASGGVLEVDGDARVGRSAHGVRDAIAAVRGKRGIVSFYGELPYLQGTTTADLTRPGGIACHDTGRATSPGILVVETATPRIELGGEEVPPTGDDILRAGCPGPRDWDVFADKFGLKPIAKGPLRFRWLTHRTFEVPLAGSRRFSGPGYSGSTSAHFRLKLRRISLRATYRRTRTPFP